MLEDHWVEVALFICCAGGLPFAFFVITEVARFFKSADELPLVQQFTVFQGYAALMFFGYIREAYRYFVPAAGRATPDGYAPVVRDFDDFYTRRLYNRIQDAWNRPLNTRAGRTIGVMERKRVTGSGGTMDMPLTGTTRNCINMASYNYLGFAEDLPQVTEANLDSLERLGTGACASTVEGGRSTVEERLCTETAAFVGKKAAVVYAMGFGTNFSGLPALFSPGTLVLSDSLNHSSLVAGLRVCHGVKVRVFPHNNYKVLESMVRAAILQGQHPKPMQWKRIVIVVEGVYSMEGEVVDLPAVVAIKKKYRCMLYVDEAHSIGALGATGRGVCEYHGVDPKDVDILMGTFTKSFGSIGGYIASDDDRLIRYLQRHSGASVFGDSLFSAAATQALTSLMVIQGKDGTSVGRDKIRRLAQNSAYLRAQLHKLGVHTLGEASSPVIPLLVYNPAKISAFSRECLKRDVAVVVVGYPATPLEGGRSRLCVSASHTKEDLDHVVAAIDDFASDMSIRYQFRFYHLFGLFKGPLPWKPPPVQSNSPASPERGNAVAPEVAASGTPKTPKARK